ncbi:restriction endonuclease subunit S [Treponema vincentii]|uniref:restriction endonuclease subunit S n=1 Tax=Treponema vincentii TaxID=69710 RepID=UPI0035F56027
MKCKIHSLYRINGYNEGIPYRLFDLASWKNGLAFKDINFSIAGVPIIKIAELNNGIGSTTAYTNQIFPNDVHLLKNDLIFSWSGNPQTSIDIFRFKLEEGWLNQHIFKVIPNENIVNKDFFYFFMKYLKPYFVKIASNKQTTGLGHITIADLKHMNIILPDMKIQHIIATILSSLDDKIELNRQINANLEQQAQAIFKEMFIENISKDVKKGILQDIAEITMGQSPDGSTYNKKQVGMRFFQGRAEFGHRFPRERLYTSDPKRVAKKDDILMSVRAPVGDINIAVHDCCIGRGLASIRSKYTYHSFLFYAMLALRQYLDRFNSEGTVFGAINKEALNTLPVDIPSEEKIKNFEQIVSPMDACILNNYKELCYLENIRDTLLPKLMSGEIDVSKIELG